VGLLDDQPVLVNDNGGEGEKFIRLFFDVFDDEDRERVRAWLAADVSVNEIYRRIRRHYKIGRSTIERGLQRLEATGWES
jgi:hypothetical protein